MGIVWRFGLLISLLFSAAILLIHTQPINDGEVRTLLAPEGCAMPCFLGIKPGLTYADEALQILDASAWVEQMRVVPSRDMSGIRLEWEWSDAHPTMLSADYKATLQAQAYETYDTPEILMQHAVVESITVVTTIPYGDIVLLLGRGLNRPDYVALKRYISRQISALYSDSALLAETRLLPCPLNPTIFWNSPVELTIGYTQIIPGGRIVCRRLM